MYQKQYYKILLGIQDMYQQILSIFSRSHSLTLFLFQHLQYLLLSKINVRGIYNFVNIQ